MVIGLAREGLDLTQLPDARTVRSVVVTDRRSARSSSPTQSANSTVPDVTYRLGGHSVDDLDGVDVVYASPGVPPEHELLVEAARERHSPEQPGRALFRAVSGADPRHHRQRGQEHDDQSARRHVRPPPGATSSSAATSVGRCWASSTEMTADELGGDGAVELSARAAACQPAHRGGDQRHAEPPGPSSDAWRRTGRRRDRSWRTSRQIDWAVLNADDDWTLRYQPRGRQLQLQPGGRRRRGVSARATS